MLCMDLLSLLGKKSKGNGISELTTFHEAEGNRKETINKSCSNNPKKKNDTTLKRETGLRMSISGGLSRRYASSTGKLVVHKHIRWGPSRKGPRRGESSTTGSESGKVRQESKL